MSRHLQYADGWTAALDRLEEDLELAEQLVSESDVPELPTAWSPPVLGPMPPDLLDRAAALHERQRLVAVQLLAAMRTNRSQQSYATRVSEATARPNRPTYFDDRL